MGGGEEGGGGMETPYSLKTTFNLGVTRVRKGCILPNIKKKECFYSLEYVFKQTEMALSKQPRRAAEGEEGR